MGDIDGRRALLASLQGAIDAVPEVPVVHTDAQLDAGATSSTPVSMDADADLDGGSPDLGAAGTRDSADAAAIRDASKRAYAILAMREHSCMELRRKLVDRGFEERIVDVLLIKLEDAGLLDDERFAELFVRSQRTGKGLSLTSISRLLREKGVSDDDAREALAEVGDDFPFALEAARKKAAGTRELAYDVRLRRVLGVLGRRGFSGSVARRAAQQALTEIEGESF